MILSFYKKTKYFWLLSKLIIIILVILDIIDRIDKIDIGNLFVQFIFTSYVFFSSIILYYDITKKYNPRLCKIFIGVINIFIGLFFAYLFSVGSVESTSSMVYVWYVYFIFWMIFIGVYDIITRNEN